MSDTNPVSVLHDSDGVPMAVEDGGTIPADTKALLLAGNDGGTANVVKVDAGGSVAVDGSGVTQPISAVDLPLPTGASTEATLAAIKAKTDNIDVALSTRAVTGLTDAELRSSPVDVYGPLTDVELRATPVDVLGPLTDAELRASAVPVSASSLPLPSGAATAALQTQPGIDIGDVTVNNAAGVDAVNVQDGGNSITVDAPVGTPVAVRLSDGSAFYDGTKTGQLPSALVGSRLDVNAGAWLGSTSPTVGQKTSADSIPVVISSDQTGVQVQGTAANAAAASGNPIQVGGVDSSGNIRRVLTQIDGSVRTKATNHATFAVTASDAVLGNNKSMISIVNGVGSTVLLRLREVYLVNTQTANVSGVIATLALRRITGHSAGTSLTPLPHDTADSLNVNVTAITGSTVAGEAAGFLKRWAFSSDEWGSGAADVESSAQNNQTLFPILNTTNTSIRPVTLRAGEGITIKCETNTTAGQFDVFVLFTQESE
jgi:hypothetical protein